MSALILNCKGNREHSQLAMNYAMFVELKDRITQARTAAKLSKSALARRCGVDPSAINHLESGRTKSLSGSLLLKMSQALNARPQWLESEQGIMSAREGGRSGSDYPAGAHLLKPSQEVPAVGTTQGGPPDRLWQELNYPVGYSDQYLEVATPDPHAYALRVVGNSMAPRIMEGEWLMVEPSAEPQPGFDVVVRTTDGQVMVRRLLSRHNDTVLLDSVNEAFQRITLLAHEIDFMHPIGGIFPPRAIKQRVGERVQTEEYAGAGRRIVQLPSDEERRYLPPRPITSEGNVPETNFNPMKKGRSK